MSVRARRALLALTLALIGAGVLLLNVHTPLMMDDYDYSFSWRTGERLAGLTDILASQAAHYRLWGGRIVTHFLAQLFLYLGKPVFNAANALMYLLFLLELCALGRRRGEETDWRMPLLAHLLLSVTPFFGVVFLWLDGACNYLWGTVLALVPLLIAKSEREGGFFDAGMRRGALALPLCFLAGWTNENTACGVLAALGLLLVRDRLKGRRVRLWRVLALAAQAAGVLGLLLAPGNFARAGEPAARGPAMELLYRFAVISYCLLRDAGLPLAFAAFALWMARRRRAAQRGEWLCVLGGCALLSAYALVGSPQISDRSLTAVIALAIAALLALLSDMELKLDGRSALMGALVLATVALSGHAALREVKAHEAAWLAQVERIEAAAAAGEASVEASSVPSRSRFTMDIRLEADPDAWPNSTLSRYYGVRVIGR